MVFSATTIPWQYMRQPTKSPELNFVEAFNTDGDDGYIWQIPGSIQEAQEQCQVQSQLSTSHLIQVNLINNKGSTKIKSNKEE